MSLRRRLVVGMLVALVAAVVTTDVVTLSSLRSFLYGRLDEQVDVAQSQAYDYIELAYQRAVAAAGTEVSDHQAAWLDQLSVTAGTGAGFGDVVGDQSGVEQPAPASGAGAVVPPSSLPRTARLSAALLAARVSPDIYVEVRDANGVVVLRRPSGSSASQDPLPKLPPRLPVRSAPAVHHFGTLHGVYLPDQPSFTASAAGQGGAPYYLGEALNVPGGVIVNMIPLAPTNQTLSSLTRIEVGVSVVVVVLLLVVTLWIVRFGLRPLRDMTTTAGAIAGGDLRQRVRHADGRSEVGRLGSALNGMLSQIEAAFTERRRSEARLRRFVADASHELRTPLTSIRGYAELLRKGALQDDEARTRAAERIEHEAARMSVMVDDLLLLARLDQGRQLEQQPVDLSKVVREAVDAARTADPGHPVIAEVDPAIEVAGDAGRLRQVVDNLLGNAQVHTPPGTPVHVAVERRDGHAVIRVADEGPGLSDEAAEHVFDRFYRGPDARGRPGTGLGLSIVGALAAAHGGVARVVRGAKVGSVFEVELPLGDMNGSDDAHGSDDTAGTIDDGLAAAPIAEQPPTPGEANDRDTIGGDGRRVGSAPR